MSNESARKESLGDIFANNKKIIIGIGLMIGIIVGTVVDAATENMGLWISLGTAFGLIFGAAIYTALSAGESRQAS